MNILVLAPFTERSLERLGQQGDITYESWIEAGRLHDPAKLAARLRDERIDIIVVEADFLTAEAFAAPTLRLAGVCRDGLNQVDVQAATDRGVPVINTPARNGPAVAELAISLMLALARQLPAAIAFAEGGGWSPIEAYQTLRGREVAGSVVGIVGLGQMGSQVASGVRCLGAKVIATDPYVSARRAKALGVKLVPLNQLLSKADFVSLHTPQAKATEGLIDAAALDLMKPTAYLINTGAPNVLNHDALVERLQARRIAGAALDVIPGHVLPASHPLLALDNLILTPHIGGASGETVTRHSRMIVEDIERFLRGERPRRLANPDALTTPGHGR